MKRSIPMVALLMALLLAACGADKDGYETDPTIKAPEPTQTQANIGQEVGFPLQLADGKLEIENVFLFDGLNPDCGNEEGRNVAAITLKNISDTYLASADISIVSSTGGTLRFVATDLPPGKTMMVFAVDNASTEVTASYGDVTCQAAFDPEALTGADVTAAAEGIHITVRNNTDEDIKKLVVYCHATLADQYFGGITYSYTINNLTAKGTAELDAQDCILGTAEVVRVVISEP